MSPEVNHDTWIEKIKSELKGKDLTSFDYTWEGEKISPFEEKLQIKRTLSRKKNNEWQIGIDIGSVHPNTNAILLKGLEYGATTFQLIINQSADWQSVFNQVHLDWISSEFQVDTLDIWSELAVYFSTYPKDELKGICWAKEELQLKLFRTYQPVLPNFKYLTIHINVLDNADHIAVQFKKLIDRIITLSDHVEPDIILSNVALKLLASEDLILNISMVRAIRLLWMQALDSMGVKPDRTDLYISATITSIKSNRSDQMISSSLMATSMIMGGVDALFIDAPDLCMTNHRWGLMAQHILRDEAYMHKVNDPLSGSNVIERLTGIIARKIWKLI